jgi:hypothetical protein
VFGSRALLVGSLVVGLTCGIFKHRIAAWEAVLHIGAICGIVGIGVAICVGVPLEIALGKTQALRGFEVEPITDAKSVPETEKERQVNTVVRTEDSI